MTDQRVTKHGNFFTMHLLSIENRKERAGGAIYQSNNEKGTLAHKIPKIRGRDAYLAVYSLCDLGFFEESGKIGRAKAFRKTY